MRGHPSFTAKIRRNILAHYKVIDMCKEEGGILYYDYERKKAYCIIGNRLITNNGQFEIEEIVL